MDRSTSDDEDVATDDKKIFGWAFWRVRILDCIDCQSKAGQMKQNSMNHRCRSDIIMIMHSKWWDGEPSKLQTDCFEEDLIHDLWIVLFAEDWGHDRRLGGRTHEGCHSGSFLNCTMKRSSQSLEMQGTKELGNPTVLPGHWKCWQRQVHAGGSSHEGWPGWWKRPCSSQGAMYNAQKWNKNGKPESIRKPFDLFNLNLNKIWFNLVLSGLQFLSWSGQRTYQQHSSGCRLWVDTDTDDWWLMIDDWCYKCQRCWPTSIIEDCTCLVPGNYGLLCCRRSGGSLDITSWFVKSWCGACQVLIDRMANTTANSRNTTWQQVVSQSERLVTFSSQVALAFSWHSSRTVAYITTHPILRSL